jgi:nitroreductase
MTKPLQPWTISADDFPEEGYASDQLEFLLGYAILAPSQHNAQPWQFRINAMDVEVLADRRRALPVLDPANRELTIGCGAALFNLRVATEYFGHLYRVELLPDPADPDLLARFHLGLRGETRSEDVLLFNAIAERRTSRQPLDAAPLPAPLVESWAEAVREEGAWLQVLAQPDEREAMAALVAEADRLLWADHAFRNELATWIRSHPGDHADGLAPSTLGIRDWMAFAGPSLVRNLVRGEGQATADRGLALHASSLVILGTESDDPSAWLRAGQALQSLLLHARSEEVWASFLNQPVEVPQLREQVASLVGHEGAPQLVLRLVYGSTVAPTPRRSVRDVLVMQKSAHH